MTAEFLNDIEKKMLELESRRVIYEIVKKYAGSHFREIERKTELPTGTVKYHLNYLVKNGLIQEEKDGNAARYYPKSFKSKNKILLGLLRQKSVRDILLFILVNNNCNHEEIVSSVNISSSTVSWHLKKLEQQNIVGYLKKGRKTFFNILTDKDELVNLLITYQESFLDSLVDKVIDMFG